MITSNSVSAPDELTDLIKRLLAEEPIGLSLAARYFGKFRKGRPTHVATVGRWIHQGVRLADGRVLRLEGFQLNGRLCTTEPAIIRFIAAQQDCPPLRVPARKGNRQTSIERQQASEAAARKLEQAGF